MSQNRISIPAAIILAGLISGGSYYAVQMKRIDSGIAQQKIIQQLEHRKSCFEDADRMKKELERSLVSGVSSIIEPIYYWNERTQHCFYIGGLMTPASRSEMFFDRWVVDVYTNGHVARMVTSTDAEDYAAKDSEWREIVGRFTE